MAGDMGVKVIIIVIITLLMCQMLSPRKNPLLIGDTYLKRITETK